MIFKRKRKYCRWIIHLKIFFKKHYIANEFLVKKGFFLRVYEERDKFRYIIEKGVKGKNKIVRDLSSCVIQKFNGCDILKSEIKKEEK